MKQEPNNKEEQVVGFFGIGLDNEDGHARVTTTDHFLLVGGSEETHQHMQSTAIHFKEGLERRGKRLEDASKDEARELLEEALERS